jgi:hypothetical protein
MVIQKPDDQHPTVRKLGLNVSKLEEVTMEAMSVWFNDKEHVDNASKRPFLKEIFRIAKAEERLKIGGIGKLILVDRYYRTWLITYR